MTSEFDELQALIDTFDLSDDDKRLIKASLWTQCEIPEIRSVEQYKAYGKLCDELGASVPPRNSAGFGAAFVEWARSRSGILCTSYGARMIEWEEAQEAKGR